MLVFFKKEGKIGKICLWVDGLVACGAAKISVAGKKLSEDKPEKWSEKNSGKNDNSEIKIRISHMKTLQIFVIKLKRTEAKTITTPLKEK